MPADLPIVSAIHWHQIHQFNGLGISLGDASKSFLDGENDGKKNPWNMDELGVMIWLYVYDMIVHGINEDWVHPFLGPFMLFAMVMNSNLLTGMRPSNAQTNKTS